MWLKVLKGERLQHRLDNGYYVTRLPGPGDPSDNTMHENRQRERMFFNQPPWTSLPISHGDRLGIPALILTLSQKLSQLIRDT